MKNRVRIDGILYPYSDAKKDIVISRELADIWKGRPGMAKKCMNAYCIVRNEAKFPHKVLAASVIKCRAYIFDSMEHVVRYVLPTSASRDIKKHDVLKVGTPGTLTLHAPRKRDKGGIAHANVGGHTKRRSNGHPLTRGERARVIAAVGTIMDEKTKAKTKAN